MDSVIQCFVLCFICLCLTTASFSTETDNPDQSTISYIFVGYKQSKPLEMKCKMSPTSTIKIQWLKDNKVINFEDLENKDHYTERIDEDKISTLVVNHPTEKDLGNYTCQLHQSETNSSIKGNQFQVMSELNIRMEASVTVIEGEELKLRCLVVSKSPPHHIWWHDGNQTYETSRDRVELKEDEKKIPNAIFSIKEAVMEDRNTYTCMAYATSNANVTEAETYVRVKDKLAALWPFLGICAEVFVLCAIILIYEKKRNKAELEESDTDQSPDQKNTPDLGKDSVRQRK